MKIRVVPTASKARAVQVVRYRDSQTVIVKHIGSAKSKAEVTGLKQPAKDWIEYKTGQEKLFLWPGETGDGFLICQFSQTRYLKDKH